MMSPKHNPLKRPILELLKQASGPLKEFELHQALGESFDAFTRGCHQDVVMFRRHFLVMNALYELHEELAKQNLYLHISALEIHIREGSTHSGTSQLSNDTGFNRLSEYYRNWEHFETTAADVKQLLNDFWERFLSFEEKQQALKVMGLETGASWTSIQSRYRRLCQQHHPDKGGNALQFVEIKEAYSNLKRVYLA